MPRVRARIEAATDRLAALEWELQDGWPSPNGWPCAICGASHAVIWSEEVYSPRDGWPRRQPLKLPVCADRDDGGRDYQRTRLDR